MVETIPGNYPDFAREQAYPTPFQNSPLLPLLLLSLATQKHTPDTKTYISKEYDYIVVGAGAGGSVVASRLTEIESVTVLLLEAGPSPPLLTEVPAISRSFGGTDIDWNFFTEPQKYGARLQGNRQVPYSSGKTVGGSSVLSSMFYIRGSPKNFDEWEKRGAEGWNWNEVFRYFIKAEDNRDPDFYQNGFHGVGGPMTIERFDLERKFMEPLISAQKRFGYPIVDPNGPNQIGIADYQGILRHGQRCSVAKGYLVPAENRTNLDIVAEAYVTKILTKGKRATGVRFDHKGISYEVRARKEVILSAGTYNTPKLLILSGIGPRNALRKFNIPLVADLPVGRNLQSHSGPVAFFTGSRRIPPFVERVQDPNNILKYVKTRKGLLASSESIFGLSVLRDDISSSPHNVPDYHIYYSEAVFQILGTLLNIPPQVYNQVFAPFENGTNFMCLALLQRPRSIGYVTLRSSDPYVYPVVQPNHLKDPEDVRRSVSVLRECYKVMGSPEMKSLGIRPLPTLLPGCEDVHGDEDLYLECAARAFILPGLHPVGTTKMGDPSDPTTVVDPELRVKGIEGLRVVDASIMPVAPTGNNDNSVIMIAEKASDMIKRDILRHWKVSPFQQW